MSLALALSADTLALLRTGITARNPPVDDSNREAYRELAAAGLMIPLHTFAKGRESTYRFTE